MVKVGGMAGMGGCGLIVYPVSIRILIRLESDSFQSVGYNYLAFDIIGAYGFYFRDCFGSL